MTAPGRSASTARTSATAAPSPRRRVRHGKPVVLLTVGRTAGAVRAARSHTGSLTSDLDVVDAACRAAGVHRVETPHELVVTLRALLARHRPRGRRVGIVGDGGGYGAVACDLLGDARLRAAGAQRGDPGAAARGPAAHRGDREPGRPRRRRRAGPAQLRPHDPHPARGRRARRRALHVVLRRLQRALRRAARRELAAADGHRGRDRRDRHAARRRTRCTGTPRPPARSCAEDVPVYRLVESAVAALVALAPRRPCARRRCPMLPPAAAARRARPTTPRPATHWPPRACRSGAAVTVARPERRARRRPELGYPVVLKALGALHKSDAGGVVLGLEDEEALRRGRRAARRSRVLGRGGRGHRSRPRAARGRPLGRTLRPRGRRRRGRRLRGAPPLTRPSRSRRRPGGRGARCCARSAVRRSSKGRAARRRSTFARPRPRSPRCRGSPPRTPSSPSSRSIRCSCGGTARSGSTHASISRCLRLDHLSGRSRARTRARRSRSSACPVA